MQQQPPQQQQQQQQQQPPQPAVLNAAGVGGPPFSPNAITTEQIQKCLDDNKNLILAILENQNLGKLHECAQFQAVLQKNLMQLAAIADAQPPPSTPPQMPMNPVPPQANNFMQQAQGATPQQQQAGGGSVPRMPFQLNQLRPQEQQQMLQFQQQQMQAQMGMRPGLPTGMLGMHQSMQSGVTQGGLMDTRGSKADGPESGPGSGGGDKGKSASGRGGGGGNRDS